jgi:hypothetical protein
MRDFDGVAGFVGDAELGCIVLALLANDAMRGDFDGFGFLGAPVFEGDAELGCIVLPLLAIDATREFNAFRFCGVAVFEGDAGGCTVLNSLAIDAARDFEIDGDAFVGIAVFEGDTELGAIAVFEVCPLDEAGVTEPGANFDDAELEGLGDIDDALGCTIVDLPAAALEVGELCSCMKLE